jgi:hypothetical protein
MSTILVERASASEPVDDGARGRSPREERIVR